MTATALPCVVKTQADGLMGTKACHMCSLKYKRNLVLDVMKQPPYQVGRLDENRKGKEELEIRLKRRGCRLRQPRATQPRGDATPGFGFLLARPQGQA